MIAIGSQSTEETIIAPAPAGSGKSTWIEAFSLALMELFQSEPELAYSIVGLVIVLQKVEDLNHLAAKLNTDLATGNPNMVALQGWTRSGQQEGFCKNPDAKCFEDCTPSSCPYAPSCELRSFREKALMAPIVGLTQERFAMLKDSDSLGSILYRTMENGQVFHRRYLIFDEKFQMAGINTLSQDTFDQASQEITKLITKLSITDSTAMNLQRRVSYLMQKDFQQLRKALRISTKNGEQDIQAGFCSLTDVELGQDLHYESFRSFLLEQRPKYVSKQLREAFTVMDALYARERCLFSKMNGFAVTRILPPNVHFGQGQAIIFDATAQIDEDYHNLEHVQILSGNPKRELCQVEFHIFTHKDLSISRQAMKSSWKISALSQLIAELAVPEPMFICTYKDYSESFADSLPRNLLPNQLQNVLFMSNRERPTIPYLGGTNGSNDFHTATQVFMLGYPRLNPRDYLIRTCAAYGPERVASELDSIPQDQLANPKLNLLSLLPSMQQYVAHHLAARLEQEIYRCALRNPDFTGRIRVYLFCPPKDMLQILLQRISGTAIYEQNLPDCVAAQKAAARRYEDGSTSYGRLALFLTEWDGKPISPGDLQAQLSISKAVWKDLIEDQRVLNLFEQFGVERSGRGRNTKLYIASKICA